MERPVEPGNGRPARDPCAAAPARRGLRGLFATLACRWPFGMLLLLSLASNLAGSVFNVFYNIGLIALYMDPAQRWAFETVAIPLYNVIAYPACFALILYLFRPLQRCLALLRAGAPVEPAFLEYCRRRVLSLPSLQLGVNLLGWLPGAVFFPLVVVVLGGTEGQARIWWGFFNSFVICALFTTAQTFFILESYLVAYLYPLFFRDTRPEQVAGFRRITYGMRLRMLWMAVAFMPLWALFFALWNDEYAPVAVLLFAAATVSSFAIFEVVGRDLLHWVHLHAAATAEVGRGNFDVRIAEQRPDEWGRLTNRFNDMTEALARAQAARENLGQFLSPEIADEVLARIPGLEVAVQEVTVVFADIRGFTRRCAGEAPERVHDLLNRFLTLALRAVEQKGGYVNKFLGDGFMALFGATRPADEHADLAIASARDLLVRLQTLNEELTQQGQEPLAVGIGIHTGPALVGCFGATVETATGRPQMRREFTAIGETVNLAQRLEQLTKACGGPILVSDATRLRLRGGACLECLGPHALPGAAAPLVVHRVAGG